MACTYECAEIESNEAEQVMIGCIKNVYYAESELIIDSNGAIHFNKYPTAPLFGLIVINNDTVIYTNRTRNISTPIANQAVVLADQSFKTLIYSFFLLLILFLNK